MTHLKDNDMDDLFRRASDKYPLRTDSTDWDRMAAALDTDPTPNLTTVMEEGDKRRKRRFFWLFLLLPLAGIGYFTWHRTGSDANHPKPGTAAVTTAPAANSSAATPGSAPSSAAPANSSASTTTPSTAPAMPSSTARTTNPTPAARTGTPAVPTPGANTVAKNTVAKNTDAANRSKTNRSASPLRATSTATAGRHHKKSNSSDNRPSANTPGGYASGTAPATRGAAANHGRPAANPGSSDITGADAGTSPGARATPAAGITPAAGTAAIRAPYPQSRLKPTRTAGDYNLTVDVRAPVMHKDSSIAKPKASAKPKSSFMYVGISGAPDLSTVKFQSSKGVGTTFGVLLGYAFNKNWAVETGVYLDRKHYYTDGEYFDTKGVNLNGLKLISVNGDCYMWEVPVNVRYNFNTEGKTKWFATAGLSTYFMTREKYYYDVSYNNGNPWQANTPWDLRKPSQYWFSIVNLSAGFEQRLGNIGNLRIEPYVRLPLSGLGTGKLNIMSTGLNIGITRRLW
jgi:hypothetical protein